MRRPRLIAGWVVLTLVFGTACASQSSPGSASRSPAAAASEAAPAGVAKDWPTYHGDASRSGVLRASGNRFVSASFAWQSGQLDADVYASPIVAAGLVIVATERDTVYALDVSSGQQRWSRHLAEPVMAATLPCGNIRPVSGITSTPVADAERRVLYVVAFVQPGRHMLYALNLADGGVINSRSVDPPGESPTVDQQRGALALANGNVYVPYGGLFGDCGQYHGWVMGVPVAGGGLIQYQVPCDRECGLWAPGGPTLDEGGDLWVSSGNGEPLNRFSYSNSVIRLSPDLQRRDYFAPSDWAALSREDRDLGSTSPILLQGGLVWISGKSATGYLLRRDHLGGIGGQAFAGQVCNTYGSALAEGALVYLPCPLDGRLMAVRVDASKPSFSTAWQVSRGAPGAPILAYGALWLIDTDSGSLAALDGQSGRELFKHPGGGSSPHFVTPAAAGSHVYAALNQRLVAVTAHSSG